MVYWWHMEYGLGNIVYDPEVQNWLLFGVILIVALIVAKMIHTFIRFGVKKLRCRRSLEWMTSLSIPAKVLLSSLFF